MDKEPKFWSLEKTFCKLLPFFRNFFRNQKKSKCVKNSSFGHENRISFIPLILQIIHRWYHAQRISFFLTLLGQTNLLSQHRSWIRITTIISFSTIHISCITKLSKITRLFITTRPPTRTSLGKSISNITVANLLQSPVWPQSSVFDLSPVTLSTSEPPNEVLNKVLNQPHTSNVCRNKMR